MGLFGNEFFTPDRMRVLRPASHSGHGSAGTAGRIYFGFRGFFCFALVGLAGFLAFAGFLAVLAFFGLGLALDCLVGFRFGLRAGFAPRFLAERFVLMSETSTTAMRAWGASGDIAAVLSATGCRCATTLGNVSMRPLAFRQPCVRAF